MAPRLAIVNRGSIRVDPADPLGSPLPGTETVVVNLARELRARGVAVTLYTGRQGGSARDLDIQPLAGLRDLPDVPDLRILWVRDYFLPDGTFDVLDRASHFLLTEDSVRDMGVLTGRSTAELSSHLGAYLPRFEAVVLASRWHADDWRRGFGLDLAHARPIHNLASHVPWAHRPPGGKPTRVVHTSHPRKAIVAVAAVAERLVPLGYTVVCTGAPALYQDDDCRVLVPDGAGGQRDHGTFGAFAATAGHVVDFRVPVPPRALGAFLDGFDLLLHPDYSEETGATTVIEALRRGLVCVVSDLGALPELVGQAGVVVAGDPWTDAFAERCAEAVEALSAGDLAAIAEARQERRAALDTDVLVAQWREVLGV